MRADPALHPRLHLRRRVACDPTRARRICLHPLDPLDAGIALHRAAREERPGLVIRRTVEVPGRGEVAHGVHLVPELQLDRGAGFVRERGQHVADPEAALFE
jgi:hypothetical protein